MGQNKELITQLILRSPVGVQTPAPPETPQQRMVKVFGDPYDEFGLDGDEPITDWEKDFEVDDHTS